MEAPLIHQATVVCSLHSSYDILFGFPCCIKYKNTRILYIVNAKKLDRFVVDTQSKLHTMMRYIPIPAAIVTSVTILMSGGDALRSRI